MPAAILPKLGFVSFEKDEDGLMSFEKLLVGFVSFE